MTERDMSQNVCVKIFGKSQCCDFSEFHDQYIQIMFGFQTLHKGINCVYKLGSQMG